MKKLKIGLFGYGCVGQGLYNVLKETNDIQVEIKRICIKNIGKERNIDQSIFTTNKWELIQDPEIQVIVELIDNADDAFEILYESLNNGKAVVTANKKMIAENMDIILELQRLTNLPVLYEGAVCASIPIIRTLEEYYDNDLLSAVDGIFNGTTNYILTKSSQEKKTYAEVLSEAQQLGFAESNPKLDVEGYDAKYKLGILATHAFGIQIKPDNILNIGIQHIAPEDLKYAEEKGFRIKLIPHIRKNGNEIYGHVLPTFIHSESPFYHVHNEFNAVRIKAAFADEQFFYGKGAGSYPTAAAVLSDLSALTYNYKYAYKKLNKHELVWNNQHTIRVYLRFSNKDILEELQITNITESYFSKSYNFILGDIAIDQLLKLNFNTRKDLFIIKIDDVKERKKSFNTLAYEDVVAFYN